MKGRIWWGEILKDLGEILKSLGKYFGIWRKYFKICTTYFNIFRKYFNIKFSFKMMKGRYWKNWGKYFNIWWKYFNIWFVYLFKMMKGRIWWGEVPGAELCQICVSAPPVERKHRRNIIAPNGPTPIYFFSLKYFTSLAKLFGPNICGYVPVKRT